VKIHDRYLLREFLTYLMLGLAGFIAIFIVVDIFEKIDVFLDNRAPLILVGRFYLYRAPEVIVQVLPVALLLATFLGLGQLNKFGELTAMRVAGLSILRILTPVFGVAVGASERFGDHPVDDTQCLLVLGGDLHRLRRFGRLVCGPPQDRRAAFGRDDRIDGVLEHQHAVRRGNGDGTPRAALADNDGNDATSEVCQIVRTIRPKGRPLIK